MIALGAIVGIDRAYDDGSTIAQRFKRWGEAQGKRPLIYSEFLDPTWDPAKGLKTYGGHDFFETAAELGAKPYINFNLLPRTARGETMLDVMAGAPTLSGLTDLEHIRHIGEQIGQRYVDVRFLHEFNAGRRPWDGLDPTTFIELYTTWSIVLKSYAPNVRTVWCMASGGKSTTAWREKYPDGTLLSGKQIVDVIGCDFYPAVKPEPLLVERKYANLEACYDFALEQGKPFSIPACSLGGGPDDPTIARRFCRWLMDHRSNLKYVGIGESIFPDGDTRIGDGSHPEILRVWRQCAAVHAFKGSTAK